MAYISTAKPAISVVSLIARPFVAFWDFLIMIAETHPKMDAVNALNATSDAELAARGTSRSDEVRRIFAGQYYL